MGQETARKVAAPRVREVSAEIEFTSANWRAIKSEGVKIIVIDIFLRVNQVKFWSCRIDVDEEELQFSYAIGPGHVVPSCEALEQLS